MDCEHRNVVVTYSHPHDDIEGLRVTDLMASAPDATREVMTLMRPRWAQCGRALHRRALSARVKRGG